MPTTKEKHNTRRNTVIASILIIALIITGALAFLTATDSKTNVFTVGKVSLNLHEPTWFDDDNNPLDDDDGNGIPDFAEDITSGSSITKDPFLENTGTVPAYVYLSASIPVAIIDGEAVELFSYEVNDGWNSEPFKVDYSHMYDPDPTQRQVVYYYNYNTILNGGEETPHLFKDDKVIFKNLTTEELESVPREINLVINGYGIQSNLEDCDDALSAWKHYEEDNPSAEANYTIKFVDKDDNFLKAEVFDINNAENIEITVPNVSGGIGAFCTGNGGTVDAGETVTAYQILGKLCDDEISEFRTLYDISSDIVLEPGDLYALYDGTVEYISKQVFDTIPEDGVVGATPTDVGGITPVYLVKKEWPDASTVDSGDETSLSWLATAYNKFVNDRKPLPYELIDYLTPEEKAEYENHFANDTPEEWKVYAAAHADDYIRNPLVVDRNNMFLYGLCNNDTDSTRWNHLGVTWQSCNAEETFIETYVTVNDTVNGYITLTSIYSTDFTLPYVPLGTGTVIEVHDRRLDNAVVERFEIIRFGNLDNDMVRINATDLSFAEEFVQGKKQPTSAQFFACDLNRNGVIDFSDEYLACCAAAWLCDIDTVTGIPYFECLECDEVLMSYAEYEAHMQTHN